MSCKSGIYAVNTAAGTAIANGGIYPVTTIIRRFGQTTNLNNSAIVIGGGQGGAGYYLVNAIANVTATAVGNVTATLYQDGVPIQGATASATAAAIGDEVVLPISAFVRLNCGCCESNLTIVISGQATTSLNLSVNVEKG